MGTEYTLIRGGGKNGPQIVTKHGGKCRSCRQRPGPGGRNSCHDPVHQRLSPGPAQDWPGSREAAGHAAKSRASLCCPVCPPYLALASSSQKGAGSSNRTVTVVLGVTHTGCHSLSICCISGHGAISHLAFNTVLSDKLNYSPHLMD